MLSQEGNGSCKGVLDREAKRADRLWPADENNGRGRREGGREAEALDTREATFGIPHKSHGMPEESQRPSLAFFFLGGRNAVMPCEGFAQLR